MLQQAYERYGRGRSVLRNHQFALWLFLVQGNKRDSFEYDALFCHRVIELLQKLGPRARWLFQGARRNRLQSHGLAK